MLTFEMKLSAPYTPALHRTLRLREGQVVTGPLVSCLMVSRGDASPAAAAIECYRRQSYANRELVIVTAKRDSAVGALVAELNDPTIRCHEVEDRVLGELRNFSVAQASGDFVCHWDDDDLYHQDRLALQMAAIAATGAKACFLSRLLLWWPERELLRVSYGRTWEGSMVADRSVVPVFPALAREEDFYVVAKMAALHALVQIDYPMGYCYTVHDRNVNDEEHFERVFSRSSAIDDCATYTQALSLIGASLPVAGR
ncbi:glycosyltransferase [Sphingomonas paeninsulae]|jgi:glycosyltransferase involved in cell wall biosynthesis|uniref:Glycosyltransferase n=1 Tax=Sphingomonas paeninsulae TaxID=2319844 RepID=A0A494T9B5_SPHPE|nr:glycosyltransferase [Sphingomonas paeninsulae]AYJ85957.1 glycosyltransferase [Sphingomonas paeninsulae]